MTNIDCLTPKVVIADSGIDVDNVSFKGNIIGGVSYKYNHAGLIISEPEFADENGHGTHCASIIKRLVPNAGMYILKVLNKDAKTSSKVLITALKHLLETDIRVINISLAATFNDYTNELKEVCDLLYKRGKILIASLSNTEYKSYPAAFKNVIGVRGSNFNFSNDFWYNSDLEIQCVADALPLFVPGVNNTYTMFGGNSKATALFTGIILNILKDEPDMDFEALNELLQNRAKRNQWSEEDISRNFNILEELVDKRSEYPEQHIKTLENIVAEVLRLKKEFIPLLHKYKLFHPVIGLNKSHCHEIIKRIESEFKTNINYDLISANTFTSLYSLTNLLLEVKK